MSPSVVVEPLQVQKMKTGKDRTGQNKPRTKWEVYEQIRVPYYVIFDRYTDQLRAFTLVSGQYQEINLSEPQIWMPTLKIGLGNGLSTVGLPVNGCAGMMLRELDSHGCRAIGAGASAARFGSTAARFSSTATRFGSTAERLAERLRAMGLILTNWRTTHNSARNALVSPHPR